MPAPGVATVLTRLRVSGFKNLVDVDVRFGPFTCVAGLNGVGKSNLFDAIGFLAALADRPLLEAAQSVRNPEGRSGDIRRLFHRLGNEYVDEMSFAAEMIVPSQGTDELGQPATATNTFLRYRLVVGYRKDEGPGPLGSLEIREETLTYIPLSESPDHLLFPNSAKEWRRSAVKVRSLGRRKTPFISTDNQGAQKIIRLHQDGGSRGKPVSYPAATLPRTVVSITNAAEGPTVALTKQEMSSWRLLQLEPSSLRRPDSFIAPVILGVDGSHLAATLYHLARKADPRKPNGGSASRDPEGVYASIANRLAELIDDVRAIRVDRDDRRQLLTVEVKGGDGTVHPADALSDGTLRFLALAVLQADMDWTGVLCLEEPENGIHPARISAMIHLLRDLVTDPQEPVGPENPLRQAIINTHSPVVASLMDPQDVLFAELQEAIRPSDGKRYSRLAFSCVSGTWRARPESGTPAVSFGVIQNYLNATRLIEREAIAEGGSKPVDLAAFMDRLPFGASVG